MEITELIIKFLSNECSQEEKVLLKKWVDTNNENRELFENYSKIWLSSSEYDFNPLQDTNKAWDSMSKQINKPVEHKTPPIIITDFIK